MPAEGGRSMTRAQTARRAGWVTLGAAATFVALAGCVAGGGRGGLFPDDALLRWPVDHRPDVAVALARGLTDTDTGTGAVPYVLGAGQALRYATMALIARPRPPQVDWAGHASRWAFPAGHTTTVALTAGLLMIAVLVRAPHGSTPVVLLIGCWGAAVGLTREVENHASQDPHR